LASKSCKTSCDALTKGEKTYRRFRNGNRAIEAGYKVTNKDGAGIQKDTNTNNSSTNGGNLSKLTVDIHLLKGEKTKMATILFVRVKSDLDPKEPERRLLERRPRFRDVSGLVQKFYGRDESTGDVCGIYFIEDQKALSNFRETELAKTIPTAYEAKDVRREVYEMLYPLYPDRGPLKA
jgi:hypothetical protein